MIALFIWTIQDAVHIGFLVLIALVLIIAFICHIALRVWRWLKGKK